MTFKNAYLEKKKLPTPAQEFVALIASATCRKETTVMQWLCGTQTPNATVKERIAEVLKIPVDELFPEEEEINSDNEETNIM